LCAQVALARAICARASCEESKRVQQEQSSRPASALAHQQPSSSSTNGSQHDETDKLLTEELLDLLVLTQEDLLEDILDLTTEWWFED